MIGILLLPAFASTGMEFIRPSDIPRVVIYEQTFREGDQTDKKVAEIPIANGKGGHFAPMNSTWSCDFSRPDSNTLHTVCTKGTQVGTMLVMHPLIRSNKDKETTIGILREPGREISWTLVLDTGSPEKR